MYNVKEFNDLEAKALNEGLYVDPQLIAATPTFAAATCTVSDKNGKRIYRAVSGISVAGVTEQVITLALCAYYETPIPTLFTVENESFPTEPPAKTPSAGSGKQPNPEAKASTPPHNQGAANTAKTSADDNPPAEKKEDVVKDDTAANTRPSAENTGTTDGGTENFRVIVGKYKNRDDNYIEQMLETEEGREFLKKIIHIGTPSAQVKPYVDKTKSYLGFHGIQLEETA